MGIATSRGVAQTVTRSRWLSGNKVRQTENKVCQGSRLQVLAGAVEVRLERSLARRCWTAAGALRPLYTGVTALASRSRPLHSANRRLRLAALQLTTTADERHRKSAPESGSARDFTNEPPERSRLPRGRCAAGCATFLGVALGVLESARCDSDAELPAHFRLITRRKRAQHRRSCASSRSCQRSASCAIGSD
jgi:hypothetical protein